MTIYTASNGLLGGTGDILLEVGTENFDSATQGNPSAPQCSVGPEPSVRFDFTVAGANAHIATSVAGGTSYGYVVYFDVFAETLGQETGILSHFANGYRPLRLRPDGRIAVYDSAGNLLGTSRSSAAGVWRRIVLVEDGTVTPRTVYLYVDSVVEMAATSANAVIADMTARRVDWWGWGDRLPAGQATGVVYRLRNALFRSFTTASESPAVIRWPDLRVSPRVVPTSEGSVTQWTGTSPSPNTWQDVDEFPNDGDTTYIAALGGNSYRHHSFYSGIPNPLPEGANILGVQLYCSGRVDISGRYFGYLFVWANGRTLYSSSLRPPTAYRGFAWLFTTRPGGSVWSRADFDPNVIEFGVASPSRETPVTRCSNICYQVVYWTDLLPLATIPSPPLVKRHYSFVY